jgi:hypothetical protein
MHVITQSALAGPNTLRWNGAIRDKGLATHTAVFSSLLSCQQTLVRQWQHAAERALGHRLDVCAFCRSQRCASFSRSKKVNYWRSCTEISLSGRKKGETLANPLRLVHFVKLMALFL